MNYATLMGAVNNMYDVNDRLGVELMGRGKWNGLKKIVTRMSADAINKAAKNNGFRCRPVPAVTVADPLCAELFGYNENYCNELLGGWWTDLKNNVAGATHKILNVGSKIPVADAAVAAFVADHVAASEGLSERECGKIGVVRVRQQRTKVIARAVGKIDLFGRL